MSSNIVTTSSSDLFGFIKVSVPTKKHKKWLEEKGFELEIVEVGEHTYYKTKVEAFVKGTKEEPFEVTPEALKAMVNAKKVFTYKSHTTVDAEPKVGMKLCWALGPASALVMMTEDEVKGPRAQKEPHRFDF